MATQAQRTASARAKLLRAAGELVSRQGSVLTSLAEIGAAAGASRGAVNFHFGSKTGLMTALVEAKAREWAQLAPCVDDTHGRPIGEVLDAHWHRWIERPADSRLAVMFIHDSLGPSPELLHQVRDVRGDLERDVSDEVAVLQLDGRFPLDRDHHAVAQALVAGVIGILATGMLAGESERDRAYRALRESLTAQAAG